jgi:hypothetical protein
VSAVLEVIVEFALVSKELELPERFELGMLRRWHEDERWARISPIMDLILDFPLISDM